MTPDLAPGFRYDQTAVIEAAEVIIRGAGPSDFYHDDPRNIVQDVLDIFYELGWLVPIDLGYEATIIDLRASLAAAERGAARYRQEREDARKVIADRAGANAVLSAEVDRFVAFSRREFERGYRQGRCDFEQKAIQRRPFPLVCQLPDCGCDGTWHW